MNNNPYTQEYHISLFNKILNTILGLAMLGMGVFFASLKWKNDSAIRFVPLTFCGGIGLLFLAQAYRRRIIIKDDSIVQVTFFKTKQLPFTAIRGQRHEQDVILLEPVSPEYPRLLINKYSDYAGSSELSAWVKENFADLNEVDKAAEEAALQEDNWLQTGERQQQLALAKKLAIGYTVVSIALSFGLLFIQNETADAVKLLIPLLGIAIMLWKRGYIFLFTNKSRSIYPHVGFGILMSAAFAFISVLKHFQIGSDLHAFWAPFFIIALLFGGLCYKGWSATMWPKFSSVMLTLMAAALYSIGAVFTINCSFDHSAPAMYQQLVMEKYITKGKGSHYHIRIEPWAPYTKIQTVSVSRSFYQQLEEGKLLQVNQKAGLLGIGWYSLSPVKRSTYIIPAE